MFMESNSQHLLVFDMLQHGRLILVRDLNDRGQKSGRLTVNLYWYRSWSRQLYVLGLTNTIAANTDLDLDKVRCVQADDFNLPVVHWLRLEVRVVCIVAPGVRPAAVFRYVKKQNKVVTL